MDLLSGILSSKSRAEIFTLLFNGDDRKYYLRELERCAGLGTSTIRFEMKNLIDLDLINTFRDGNRLYYQANTNHPLYSVVKELILTTKGPHLKLQAAFSKIDAIELAFIFGSYAKGELKSHSDIDLFIIGAIKNMALTEITYKLQKNISLEINYHKFSIGEVKKRIKENNHFLISLKKEDKIFLKGNEGEFKNLFK